VCASWIGVSLGRYEWLFFSGAQGFVKSKSMVEWSTSEVVPSRRSSRNFGLQRRAWHHLLRANPDEHDPVTSGQTSTASSPGREQTGQRTKLFKSSSMKSSSDSLKSDVSGSPQKASFSQRARVSATNLPIDRKRTQKELTTDQVKLSKKLRHSSTTHPVKENSVTTVSAPVPSQSGITYTFTENGLVHSNHDPAPDLSFLSYRLYVFTFVFPVLNSFLFAIFTELALALAYSVTLSRFIVTESE